MFKFPEPLYASPYMDKPNCVCLVCGSKKASGTLRTSSEELIPICDDCEAKFNFHTYFILKRINIRKLIWNLFLYKLTHLKPSIYTIYKQLNKFQSWAKRMKKFKI